MIFCLIIILMIEHEHVTVLHIKIVEICTDDVERFWVINSIEFLVSGQAHNSLDYY